MLKKRIVTAMCLLPVVVYAILWAPPLFFNTIVYIFVAVASFEWAQFAGMRSVLYRSLYVLGGACLSYALYHSTNLQPLYWVNGLWWLLALVAIVSFPNSKKFLFSKSLTAVIGYCILIPFMFALISYKENAAHGGIWILFICSLVWAADTGAYFAGKLFGRHKLAKHVSPGKTWEGCLGGLCVTLFISIILRFYLHIALSNHMLLILVSIVVPLSVIGDLTESLFKRMHNLKDSGQILPGHGGILDRIDGLLPVLPISIFIFQ